MLEVWNSVIEEMLIVSRHALERWRERTGMEKVDISKPLSLAVPYGAQYGNKSFLLKYDDAVFPVKKVGRHGFRNVVCTTLTAAQATSNIEMYGNWHAPVVRQERVKSPPPVVVVSEPDDTARPAWSGLNTYQGPRKRKAKQIAIDRWEQMHNLIQRLGSVPDEALKELAAAPGLFLNVIQSELGRRRQLQRARAHAQLEETEKYAINKAAQKLLPPDALEEFWRIKDEARSEKIASLQSEGRWLGAKTA